MTARSTVAFVAFVMVVAATGVVALQAGATTQPAAQTQSLTDVQAQVAQPSSQGSFNVVSVSAPDSAAPDGNITVVALVENPNQGTAAEAVEFRLGGDVVDRQRVAIDGNSVQPVSFDVSTAGLDPGEYVHSVFTENDGVNQRITISESFTVSDLDAPANVTAGDTVVANATVGNPNDFESTQRVTFRFGGSVLVDRQVTLGAGNSTTFTAEVDSSGVEPGTYAHGVFARDTGQVALIDVEEPEEPPATASVSFSDQASDGTSVTVDSVETSEGGFVVIHDASLLDGEVLGSVIGVSEPLEPGLNENVSVALFQVPGGEYDMTELTENQTLIAMPHLDTNGNGVYDFLTSNGTEDGPYTSNGSAVTDAGNVTISPTETPTNGTATPAGTPTPAETPTSTPTETPDNETATPTEAPGNGTA